MRSTDGATSAIAGRHPSARRGRSCPRFVLLRAGCTHPRHHHGSITHSPSRGYLSVSPNDAAGIMLSRSTHSWPTPVKRTTPSIHSSLFALCFFPPPLPSPPLYLLDWFYLSPSTRWAITADSPMIACFFMDRRFNAPLSLQPVQSHLLLLLFASGSVALRY